MALPPDTSTPSTARDAAQREVFLREVDDAVRQDQLEGFMSRYGKALLAIIVIALLAFGGWIYWDHRQTKAREERAEAYVQALDSLQSENLDAAKAKLTPIAAASGSDANVTSARLLLGGIALRQDRKADALRLFRQVSADGDAPQPMRDLAIVREVATEFDAMKPQDVVDLAWKLAQDFAPDARALAKDGQQFIIVPPERIVENPAIFQWGLQDRLLDIAESYIGLPVAYDGVAINYTVADGREVSTRKWHRDWEDRRMLKVAVYIHDVDTDGGPFEAIARHDTVQSDQQGYSYELADDAELARRLGPDFAQDVVSCTGRRGTVIFCDTARFFHRGKPATARDRAALFYSYFANPPRHPFLCERTGLDYADAVRLSVTMPPRQRLAATWRRQLPPVLRMIPPASL